MPMQDLNFASKVCSKLVHLNNIIVLANCFLYF